MTINTIKTTYATWLNTMSWDFFGTFTARYHMSIKSARRAMERFYNLIKKKKPMLKLFWVAEKTQLDNGYHIHALIDLNESNIKIKSLLEKTWQIVSCGKGAKNYNNVVLKPYDKNLGANHYICKDIFSNDNYDLFLD